MRRCSICREEGHRKETCGKLKDAPLPPPTKGVALSDEEIDTIVSLRVNEQMTVDEIAEHVERSTATVRRYLMEAGISLRERRIKGPPVTNKQWYDIRTSRDHGMTSLQIAPLMKLALLEINIVFGSSNYEHYLRQR